MKICVGNLSHSTSEADLRQAFETYGGVTRVELLKDAITALPRGFAFVVMPAEEEALAAIAAMDGEEFGGTPLRVTAMLPPVSRPDALVNEIRAYRNN
jgi:RNA recognition motif-containing protein